MTNEITIFPTNGNDDEFLSAQPNNQPTHAVPVVQSPLQRVHRLLRGRYLITIVLCTIGAASGAIFGWTSKRPAFRVDGFVDVNPLTVGDTMADRVMPMYRLYVNSQVQLLQSDRVIAAALTSDDWLSVGKAAPANDPLVFGALLDVGYIRDSSLIKVSFLDYRGDVANAAVKATLKAYNKLYGEQDQRERVEKKNHLKSRQIALMTSRDAKQKQIDGLAQKYGTDDLGPMHEAKMRDSYNLEQLLNQEEAALNIARARQDTMPVQAPPNLETLIDQIAQTDAKMRDYLAQKETAETTLNNLRHIYGENSTHRRIDYALLNLEIINKRIADYAKAYPQRFLNGPQARNPTNPANPDMVSAIVDGLKTPQDVEHFATQVEARRKQFSTDRVALMELGTYRTQIQATKSEVAQINDQIRDITKNVDAIEAEIELTQRIQITYPREAPTVPTVDKRKQFAAMGFMGGGAVPLALLLLIGLMDRRYRYSDDTNTDLAHLPLLGVLPNLPDRLSDPEQAAIASHCVHQIRAMLQIDGTGNTRHVFAITSANSGDGKTSLTLSLGLSYAACGARTLLIDCDLVGAGLSSRLNIRSPQGLLDAIATRTLLQYVHSTDAADVAILPAGSATPQQASALSPVALRRLIIEAKRHFEVILIDTGPVLGSIEASLVGAAVDAVILTVSRGQHRAQVDKAVAHLTSIGARIAGIVFNRANSRDFEAALSGQSKRLHSRAANGNSPGTSPFGPVARAVASASFKDEK